MMHLGTAIRRILKEKGHTVVWLSEQLSCSRTNVYKIFEKQDLDTELLRRICTTLDTDFFKLLSEDYKNSQSH